MAAGMAKAMETPHFRKTLVGRAWADEWEYAHYENQKKPQGGAVLDRRKMVTSFVFFVSHGAFDGRVGRDVGPLEERWPRGHVPARPILIHRISCDLRY